MEHRKRQQQPKGQESDYERRFISQPVEYRAVEGSEMGEVFGYALKWEAPYDMGGFTETIARGALDNADMKDVRILQDHLSHLILGRTKSGTATVGTDEVGMWYRSSLPNSPNGQNMRESLLRGDVDQSSWGFKIRRDDTGRRTGDKWEIRDGREYRTIYDISIVFDASPVTFPANPDTTAAKRSRDEFFSEKRDDMEEETPGEAVVIGETMPGKVVPAWEIGWMFSTVADCTATGNSFIRSLNYWIEAYAYYAQDQTDKSATFIQLLEQAKATKSAIISLIDGHLDALKALNGSENRNVEEAETPETVEQKSTEQINTFNPDTLAMEIELLEAEIRAKNLNYEICN